MRLQQVSICESFVRIKTIAQQNPTTQAVNAAVKVISLGIALIIDRCSQNQKRAGVPARKAFRALILVEKVAAVMEGA